MGFPSSQPGASGPSLRQGTGNGLLSAVSASNRAPDNRGASSTIAPPNGQRAQGRKSPLEEDIRTKSIATLRDDAGPASQSISIDSPGLQPLETRNPHGTIGKDLPISKTKDPVWSSYRENENPLENMTSTDRFSFKGFRFLMSNYPDYLALVQGIDPQTLGLDLTTNE